MYPFCLCRHPQQMRIFIKLFVYVILFLGNYQFLSKEKWPDKTCENMPMFQGVLLAICIIDSHIFVRPFVKLNFFIIDDSLTNVTLYDRIVRITKF